MNGAERALKIGDKTYKEGDVFSLNGSKGLVYDTAIETMDASENERFIEYMNIVDKYRVLGVRTNAENPQDAQNAINMGAEGIGLFRIEHMFYGANSEQPLAKLRKMILSSNTEERVAALDELRPFVIEAVRETMRVMDGKSVTFRLLDPPLHEFVPHTAEKQQELADEFGISVDKAVFFAFGGFLNLFEVFYKFRVYLNILKGGENVFPFFFVGNNFVHKLAVVIFLGKFLFFRSFGNFRRI
jgi:pyruvate,orthophosphate dikinase